MSLNWSKWQELPNTTYQDQAVVLSNNFAPVAVSTAQGDANLFIMDKNSSLFQTYWDGQKWEKWRPLGGTFLNMPSVISRGKGLLDIVGIGTDNRMYHKGWNGQHWFSWLNGNMDKGMQAWGSPIGAPVSPARLAITTWPEKGNTHLDVCAIAANGNLLHMETNDIGQNWYGGGKKETWKNLGGICSLITTICRGDNYLDVFVVNTEHEIFYKGKHPANWTEYHKFPDNVIGTPAVVSRMGATLDIVGRSPSSEDSSYHVKKIYWNGSNEWGPKNGNGHYWEDLGAPFQNGYFEGSPSMITRGENLLDIFCIGGGGYAFGQKIINKNIYHKAWNGSNWVPTNIQDGWRDLWNTMDLYETDSPKLCPVALSKEKIQVIVSRGNKLYYSVGSYA